MSKRRYMVRTDPAYEPEKTITALLQDEAKKGKQGVVLKALLLRGHQEIRAQAASGPSGPLAALSDHQMGQE